MSDLVEDCNRATSQLQALLAKLPKRSLNLSPERERELQVTVSIKTFGTREQARQTAEHIKAMLAVELHQDVRLTRVDYREM